MKIDFTNSLKQRILFELGEELKVRCIFQSGSSLFFDNFHDMDFVVLVDNLNESWGKFKWGFKIKQFEWIDKRVDCFLWDTAEYAERIAEGTVPHYVSLSTLWVIKHPEYICYGSIPKEWEDFDWEKSLTNIVIANHKRSGRCVQSVFQYDEEEEHKMISKWFYWDWIAVCLLLNKEVSLSEEQMKVAQHGHDKKVSQEEYLFWKECMQKIVNQSRQIANSKVIRDLPSDYIEFEEYIKKE